MKKDAEQSNQKKVIIIIGAGATYADGMHQSMYQRPPLDKKFFNLAKKDPDAKQAVMNIHREMESIYGLDIFGEAEDSLEWAMVKSYPDIFNPSIGAQSFKVFKEIVELFTKRLANTTNKIKPTDRMGLYKILTHYLKAGVRPKDLCLLTFNQDTHIEKILEKIDGLKMFENLSGQIFNFPFLYALNPSPDVTSPRIRQSEIFSQQQTVDNRILVLKLHGSLNWYSLHKSKDKMTSRTMLSSNRKILITARKQIAPDMILEGKKKRQYTFPVIVPPVVHKAQVLNKAITPIWKIAETRIEEADEIVVFGYSFPDMDFESMNMLERAIKKSACNRIEIINPDIAVAAKLRGVFRHASILAHYDVKNFLARRS